MLLGAQVAKTTVLLAIAQLNCVTHLKSSAFNSFRLHPSSIVGISQVYNMFTALLEMFYSG